MSLRNGNWTSFPNDAQIRREANREYWKFKCPVCGEGATGQFVGDIAKHRYCVNYVHCHMCGWEWKDPLHYHISDLQQTNIDEFLEAE